MVKKLKRRISPGVGFFILFFLLVQNGETSSSEDHFPQISIKISTMGGEYSQSVTLMPCLIHSLIMVA